MAKGHHLSAPDYFGSPEFALFFGYGVDGFYEPSCMLLTTRLFVFHDGYLFFFFRLMSG